jgi:hypothetical protein
MVLVCPLSGRIPCHVPSRDTGSEFAEAVLAQPTTKASKTNVRKTTDIRAIKSLFFFHLKNSLRSFPPSKFVYV